MAALTALPFLVWSRAFHDEFLVPKLLALYLAGAVACLFLASRGRVAAPGRESAFLAALFAWQAFAALASPAPQTGLRFVILTAFGASIWLALRSLDGRLRRVVLRTLFAVAVAEALLVCGLALIARGAAPAVFTPARGGGAIGTMGNPEFLATLLAVGFLLGVQYAKDAASRSFWRALFVATLLLLLAAITLTGSKGTMLLLGFWLVTRYPVPRIALVVGGVAAVAVIAFLRPASIRGRLLLWAAAGEVALRHPLGVGPARFGAHYLEGVDGLFSAHPSLVETLGSHTAAAADAHQILLQYAAELGAPGLVLAAIFARWVWRVARADGTQTGAALLVLLAKSFYTVVLGAVTSLGLFVALLACSPRDPPAQMPLRNGWRLALAAMALLALPAAWVDLADGRYQRGLHQLALGKHEDAFVQFDAVAHVDPEHVDALLGMAQIRFEQGSPDEMDGYLRRALALRRDMDTCKIAAHMYFYSRRHEDALPLYEFLNRVYPEHLTSIVKRALIRMEQGEYEAARRLAEEALELEPRLRNESDARNRQIAARILADLGPQTEGT